MSELTDVIDNLTEALEECRAEKAEMLTMLRKVQINRWDYPELNALIERVALCSCGHDDQYHFDDGEGFARCRYVSDCRCVKELSDSACMHKRLVV